MPEMTFTVRWPDGRVDDCYSPSLVMHDHLAEDTEYTVAEFVARASEALDEASARVSARYGFTCTSAIAQRDDIRGAASAYPSDATVRVLRMRPALPAPVA